MKKQFNLEYYLAHPETKVVTRDGMDARVICTDAENNHPIVALVNSEQGYFTFLTNEEGSLHDMHTSEYDLFFDLHDPEKKKVPLTYEDLMERVKAGKSMWVIRPNCAVLILGFHNANIKCAINFDSDRVMLYTYSDLMEWCEFADGDKTWKEVKE